MAKRKTAVPKSPRIVELDAKDFRDYVGKTPVPERTLLEQIEKARTTAPRRDERDVGDAFDEEELTGVAKLMFQILDFTLYLVPLLAVHIVLNMLVRMQYAQPYVMNQIVFETLSTIPVLAIIHVIFHPLRHTRVFRIVSFFLSLFIGGYLLYATNEEGYYAVMKRAPPLGTLWVWLFLEMEWHWAATCLVVIAFWKWKKGYEI